MQGPNRDDDSLLQMALSLSPSREDLFSSTSQQANTAPGNISDSLVSETNDDTNTNLLAQKVPAIASDPQRVDDMIASQMAKLSVDDREQVYLDVHGVPSDEVAETPELVHLRLLDLQNQIERLPDKQAYIIAEKLNSTYVHDRDFRLAFLRCEKFDCQKAALRIVRHFQMKMDLFGMDKLVLHITQDDLDADSLEVQYSCSARYLNQLDKAGRVVNLLVTVARVFKTDAVLRKAFYSINMTGLSNVEVQRRGSTVVIQTNGGELGLSAKNRELNWKLAKVNQASPVFLAAIHYCFSNEAWREQQAFAKTSMSQPQQVRIRLHHGTVQECLEELRGHGIDPGSIPLNDNGEITDLVEARQAMEAQRRYERLNFPLRSTIHVPFSADVLLGKGTPIQNHQGNKMLRQLVSEHIKQYDKSRRSKKKEIAFGIVDAIRQSGGLFLKQEEGSKWTLVNDDVARLKVTATFRTFRQSQKL